MLSTEREAIIQKIVEESNQASKEPGKQRVLVEWRAKLEKQPPHLTPH